MMNQRENMNGKKTAQKKILKRLKVNLELRKHQSSCTSRCSLSQSGLIGRYKRMTPLLKTNHQKARLEFAKQNVYKLESFWENVLWIDEAKMFYCDVSALCLRMEKGSRSRKEHCAYCEIWMRQCCVLGLFWFIWHRMS